MADSEMGRKNNSSRQTSAGRASAGSRASGSQRTTGTDVPTPAVTHSEDSTSRQLEDFKAQMLAEIKAHMSAALESTVDKAVEVRLSEHNLQQSAAQQPADPWTQYRDPAGRDLSDTDTGFHPSRRQHGKRPQGPYTTRPSEGQAGPAYAKPTSPSPVDALPKSSKKGKELEVRDELYVDSDASEDKRWAVYAAYLDAHGEAALYQQLKCSPKHAGVAKFYKIFGTFPTRAGQKGTRRPKIGEDGLSLFSGKDATQWILKYDRAMADAGKSFAARRADFLDYVKPKIFPALKDLRRITPTYTDFLVRVQTMYRVGDNTANRTPMSQYERLRSKPITLCYTEVLEYINAWEAVTQRAVEGGFRPESVGHLMLPLPKSLVLDVYREFGTHTAEELLTIQDAKPYLDYLRLLCERAAERVDYDRSDPGYVIAPTALDHQAVYHAEVKESERRRVPTQTAMTPSGKTLHPRVTGHRLLDEDEKSKDSSVEARRSSSPSLVEEEEETDVTDLAKHFDQLKIMLTSATDKLEAKLEKTQKDVASLKRRGFADSGATLAKSSKSEPEAKPVRKRAPKGAVKQVTLETRPSPKDPAPDVEPESEDFTDASYSELESDDSEDNHGYVDTIDISVIDASTPTGQAPVDPAQPLQPPASDEALRCRYCWRLGHRMKACDVVWKDAKSGICVKAGPSFYVWEAGSGDTKLSSVGVPSGTRLFIGKEWILSMYRSIGVRAAIFLYLYACGDLYGWDFPGSAAVRRYRESARAGDINWAAIKYLDYNSHVRKHCPADVLKRRRIDLRRMYEKLKASYPDYQGLWRVDPIVLQQMDPGYQVEAVAACPRITLRDLVRSHGLRMSEAKRAGLINSVGKVFDVDDALDSARKARSMPPDSAPRDFFRRNDSEPGYKRRRVDGETYQSVKTPRYETRAHATADSTVQSERTGQANADPAGRPKPVQTQHRTRRYTEPAPEGDAGTEDCNDQLSNKILKLSFWQYAAANKLWAKKVISRLANTAGYVVKFAGEVEELDKSGNARPQVDSVVATADKRLKELPDFDVGEDKGQASTCLSGPHDLLDFLMPWECKDVEATQISTICAVGHANTSCLQNLQDPSHSVIVPVGVPGQDVHNVNSFASDDCQPSPCVPVRFGSKDAPPVPVMMDTGATCSVMSTALAERLGLELESTDTRYYSFNSSSPRPFVGLTRMMCFIGSSISVEVSFYVTETRSETRQCLLGAPFVYKTCPWFEPDVAGTGHRLTLHVGERSVRFPLIKDRLKPKGLLPPLRE